MKIELHFDEEMIQDSIYDTLNDFFYDPKNVKDLLKDDRRAVLTDLASQVWDAVDCSLPSKIQVI